MALSAEHRAFVANALHQLVHEADAGRVRPATLKLVRKAQELVHTNGRKVEVITLPPTGQLALDFSRKLPKGIARRGRKKWARYSFELVEKARRMRARGVSYRDIADSLNEEHKLTIRWITIRDWCQRYYRVTG